MRFQLFIRLLLAVVAIPLPLWIVLFIFVFAILLLIVIVPGADARLIRVLKAVNQLFFSSSKTCQCARSSYVQGKKIGKHK